MSLLFIHGEFISALILCMLQGLKSVLDEEKIKLWEDLYDATDIYTDRWLSSGLSLKMTYLSVLCNHCCNIE